MEEATGKADGGEVAVSELDALKLESESLKSELKARDSVIAGLEKVLAEKDGEIDATKQLLDTAITDSVSNSEKLRQAVAAYQEMVAQANPGLVAEMVKGDTIEEIDESVKAAQALVEKVKQEVAVENARVRVPAGAPQRTPLDLSGLSSREKIRYAMEG
jgi:arginine deiminase